MSKALQESEEERKRKADLKRIKNCKHEYDQNGFCKKCKEHWITIQYLRD